MNKFDFQAMTKHGFLIIPKTLLQQQIENAEIAIIENAGHEVNTDNPTLLGQKLNVFFKQYV